jgi:uncharacterized RDD family membrane protein YckC
VSSGYLDLPVESLPLASIGQRAIARILDTVLMAVPSALLLVPYLDTSTEPVSIDVPFWVTIAVVAVFAVYEVVCVALWSQTLGKRLFRVRVVRIDDGQRTGWSKAAIRALVPLAASAVPYVGPFLWIGTYLVAVVDARRQGLHDKAAGTIVIHALRAETPLPPPPPH